MEAQVSRLTKAIEKPSPEKGSSGPVAAEARGPEVVVLPSAELAHLAALEILAGLKTRDEAILFGFTFDREDLADGLNKARLRGCKVMLVVDRRQAASGAREQLRVLHMAQHVGLDIRTVQGFPLGPAFEEAGRNSRTGRRLARKSAADPRRV